MNDKLSRFDGYLVTKRADLESADIERIKREVCSSINCANHSVERKAHGYNGKVPNWLETHKYHTIENGLTASMELQFNSQPTSIPTRRTFSISIAFSGKNYWDGHCDAYEKIKSTIEKQGLKLDQDYWPFSEKTPQGASASRKIQERISSRSWPVARNFE